MLGLISLILDVFVLLMLIRLTIGDLHEGIARPLTIPLITAFVIQISHAYAATKSGYEILIQITAILIIGVLLAMVVLAFYEVRVRKGLIIAGCFVGYKVFFDICAWLISL